MRTISFIFIKGYRLGSEKVADVEIKVSNGSKLLYDLLATLCEDIYLKKIVIEGKVENETTMEKEL